MPIGPQDIVTALSIMENMVFQTCCNAIDQELQRQTFVGQSIRPFVIGLPGMSPGVRERLIRTYREAGWDRVEIWERWCEHIQGRAVQYEPAFLIWHRVPMGEDEQA